MKKKEITVTVENDKNVGVNLAKTIARLYKEGKIKINDYKGGNNNG